MAAARRRKPSKKRIEALEDAIDVAILRYRLATMTGTVKLEDIRRDLNADAKKRRAKPNGSTGSP
jgi:hypothetical protein